MSALQYAIGATISLALIVVGITELRLRRVVGPGRQRRADWKQQGLGQLATGVFFLSATGPGLLQVHGWARVWVTFIGILVSLGLMSMLFFDDYWAWDDARRLNNRR